MTYMEIWFVACISRNTAKLDSLRIRCKSNSKFGIRCLNTTNKSLRPNDVVEKYCYKVTYSL